jgi:ribosome-associated protein
MTVETIMSIIIHEVTFKYFTASGPGGQNLQKNKTGVQLFWNIDESSLPLENQEKIRRVNRTTKEGFLVQFKSQTERSLDMNKKNAISKLENLIELSLYVPKTRKATKPTRGSVRRRLTDKKVHKDRKSSRRGNKVSEW